MTYAHDFIVLVYLTTWTAVKLGIFTHITFTKLRRCSQSINSLIYVYSIQLLFMTAWSQLLSYFFVPSSPKKIFYITLCYCTPTHPPPARKNNPTANFLYYITRLVRVSDQLLLHKLYFCLGPCICAWYRICVYHISSFLSEVPFRRGGKIISPFVICSRCNKHF